MKTVITLLVFALCLSTGALSQVQFTRHIITPGAGTTDNPTYVLAADIDNDGHMDVVSGSFVDNKVAWYENDGNQNFTPHIITMNAIGVAWLHAEDMDNDNDIDVLSASAIDDKVAWYENNGVGDFTTHVIDSSANLTPGLWYRFTVYAYDVDSDGDMDAMSGSWEKSEVLWHENDGQQNFTTHLVHNPGQRTHVIAKDLDGDNDVDLVSSSYRNNFIAWYENDGNQNFMSHVISDSSRGRTIFAEDIDYDGDIDLAAALTGSINKIEWYENDGNRNFVTHEISNGPTDCNSIFFADVDQDSFVDILFGCRDSDLTGWLKNDGNGNFTNNFIANDAGGPPTVWGEDMDSDGDVDIIVAGIDADRVSWYESGLATSIPFIEDFPNSAIDTTNWPAMEGTPDVAPVFGAASPPHALFISAEGSSEVLTSRVFDLSSFSGLVLALYQSQLDAEAPEGVAIEYYADTGAWQLLHQYLGSNDTTPFLLSSFPLPNDAYHSGFQFRFRAVGAPYSTPGFEGWYFDTIYLGDSTGFPRGNIFYDQSDFDAAASKLGIANIIDFEDIETNPINIDTYLSRDEFDGGFYANQGVTFSNPNGFPLFISPGGLSWNPSNSLSVGRFPFDPAPAIFSQDDDLTITLSVPSMAIGFTFVDNRTSFGEFVQFLNSHGDTVAQVLPPPNHISNRAFLGIISPENPIAAVNIVERENDGDDVNYDDFLYYIADVTSVYNEPSNAIPQSFELQQNYPNPFNPTTQISFDLPKQSQVAISIYNTTGQLVRQLVNDAYEAGSHTVIWNGSDEIGMRVASGLYLYTIKAAEYVQTRKMIKLQ